MQETDYQNKIYLEAEKVKFSPLTYDKNVLYKNFNIEIEGRYLPVWQVLLPAHEFYHLHYSDAQDLVDNVALNGSLGFSQAKKDIRAQKENGYIKITFAPFSGKFNGGQRGLERLIQEYIIADDHDLMKKNLIHASTQEISGKALSIEEQELLTSHAVPVLSNFSGNHLNGLNAGSSRSDQSTGVHFQAVNHSFLQNENTYTSPIYPPRVTPEVFTTDGSVESRGRKHSPVSELFYIDLFYNDGSIKKVRYQLMEGKLESEQTMSEVISAIKDKVTLQYLKENNIARDQLNERDEEIIMLETVKGYDLICDMHNEQYRSYQRVKQDVLLKQEAGNSQDLKQNFNVRKKINEEYSSREKSVIIDKIEQAAGQLYATKNNSTIEKLSENGHAQKIIDFIKSIIKKIIGAEQTTSLSK